MAAPDRPQIAQSDFCDAFEQDEGRLFAARECWYCKHGDFGILTEHPTQNGVCRHPKNSTAQASEKQEERL